MDSGYNPGSSGWCTLVGIIFYGAILGIGGYTASFSIALWRQFFAPLNSIWRELQSKSYCSCCCALITRCTFCHFNQCAVCWTECIGECLFYVPARIQRTVYCLSPHCLIYALSIIYVLFGCMERGIDAVPPIGICIMGTRDAAKTIRYHIVPETVFLILSALFLAPAIVLLIRIAGSNGNRETRKEFRHLQWRMLAFFLCILVAWSLFVAMISFIFYLERPQFEEAADERTTCMLLQGGQNVDDCLSGFKYWTGWYVLAAMVMPIAGTGSLVLSCNTKNVQRWKLLVKEVSGRICCCGRREMKTRLSLLARMATVKGDVSSTRKETTGTASTAQSQSITSTPGDSAKNIVVEDDSVLNGHTVELTTR